MMKVFWIDSESGSSQYTEILYPAGEMQVRLTDESRDSIKRSRMVCITSDIRTPEDVLRLCHLRSAIDGVSGKRPEVRLVLPYLPYARADRRFCDGDCHGLSVFAGIINGLGFSRVFTMDAHSPVAASLMPNLVDVSPRAMIDKAHSMFSGRKGNLLFPDEGARNRYDLNANRDRSVMFCSKKRDPISGKLLGFDVPKLANFDGSATMIVDDICDGGGTFIGIAEKIKVRKFPLALYVTHGIFSKGFDCLLKSFDRIYTTDTFSTTNSNDECATLPAREYLCRIAAKEDPDAEVR